MALKTFVNTKNPALDQTFRYKGADLSYYDAGSGEALLFIHEWNGSSQVFVRANLPILQKSFRVITFDLPGFGASEAIAGFECTDIRLLISELMNFLGIERFHLMGFCLGASMSLDYFLYHPQRVKSLILLDVTLSVPFSLRFLSLPVLGRLFYHVFSRTKIGLSVFLRFVNNQLLIGDDELFDAFQNTTYINAQIYVRSIRRHLDDFTSSLARQNQHPPCLIITSNNTLKIFYRDSLKLHKLLPASELIVMQNCGHYIQLEKPKTLSLHVEKFIQKHV
ncbi:MAG: alpha/beta hydrolase [Candidatus Cloacimonetes bacterium]|nr:alpha/beta hydrolase [Candidatus Cloacimonadota bacterium]